MLVYLIACTSIESDSSRDQIEEVIVVRDALQPTFEEPHWLSEPFPYLSVL